LLSRRVIAQGDEIVTATSTIDPDSGTPAVSIVPRRRRRPARCSSATEAERRTARSPSSSSSAFPTPRCSRRQARANPHGAREGRSDQRRQHPPSRSASASRPPAWRRREADELALLLRAGSLSAPIDIVEERVIGPSLGKPPTSSAGVRAVLFSFLFVMGFFIVYYKTFGVVTNLALLLNLLLVVSVMSLFGATLTLPGLAGIALTIGMSVDANVLINERIREELRAGTSPLASIGIGYEKASGTILDANITALLGGIALFSFGSGPIRGFALSLCVGILTSMYTAVSASRGIASLFYSGRKKLARLSI
jgi:preprotein translocase subunit SecD